MAPSSRLTSSRRWLGLLLLAWGTSAALVVGQGLSGGIGSSWDLIRAAVCAAWIGFAWHCCMGRHARRRMVRGVACLLIVTLPAQGFAGIVAAARGPAHYHADGSHSHGDIRHHHHSAGAEAIPVEDAGPREAALASEETRRAALDAAAALPGAAAPRPRTHAIQENPFTKPKPRFPALHERPPRVS